MVLPTGEPCVHGVLSAGAAHRDVVDASVQRRGDAEVVAGTTVLVGRDVDAGGSIQPAGRVARAGCPHLEVRRAVHVDAEDVNAPASVQLPRNGVAHAEQGGRFGLRAVIVLGIGKCCGE